MQPIASRFALVAFATLVATLIANPQTGFAHSNPPGCAATGVTILLTELRDTNMDGVGDQAIAGGSKIEGETIYYQAVLPAGDPAACGFQGGTICIDPPGGGNVCVDVTPAGGVPLVCVSVSCSPAGVAQVTSNQVPYVVSTADFDPLCAGQQIRAVGKYQNGTSHFGGDVFPINANTPLCNPVQPSTPPNHYQCFEVHHGPFQTMPGVMLNDAFGNSVVTVGTPKRICNPADKNDEDPTAPDDPEHLAFYKIKQTSPAFVPLRDTEITNQFGTITADITKPEALLVPSSKDHVMTPPPPANPTINHYKCYKASRTRFRDDNIKVEDQFATLMLDILKPVRLCAPVDKNGEGIPDPTSFLMCYKVRIARGTPKFTGAGRVFVANQFGDDIFETFRPTELCVPSTFVP